MEIPLLSDLHQEVQTWSSDRNIHQKSVDWQFTVEDARCKLKHLYPIIITELDVTRYWI